MTLEKAEAPRSGGIAMNRRVFIKAGAAGAAAGLAAFARLRDVARPGLQSADGPLPPGYSVIPVVGDGKWIWTEPPKDHTGYLEPRSYRLKIGIELTGRGNATNLAATTTAPVVLPEQQIEHVDVQTQGCAARLRQLAPEAGQLLLVATGIAAGQTLTAMATMRLTLHKQYQAYAKDRFPVEQTFPQEFEKQYLYDSPGIQTRVSEVRELARRVAGELTHPWDKARAFYQWVWENIRPQIGAYTSVVAALRDRVGDCEERAAVFVALCRVSGIPARLVWVPNHNWAEMCLLDEHCEPHWVPVHTSCYNWFGWTGAHELVLQKGDSIHVPEKRKPQRLLADWMQWLGARPAVRYHAELTPLPEVEGADPGPGARRKDEKGEWIVTGDHPLDPYLRDGARAGGGKFRLESAGGRK